MFDGITYINLAHRHDRKTHVLNELAKISSISTNIHRIDAVLEPLCGHLGCGQSHVKALELAIEQGWESVLIVEDDLIFTQPADVLHSRISDAFSIDWDVLMLGFGHISSNVVKHPYLAQVTGATCAHGYIVRKHFYHILLATFQNSVEIMRDELANHIKACKDNITKLNYCSAIDQKWRPLQDKHTFYCFNPVLGDQYGKLYSDNNCSIEYQKNYLQDTTKLSMTPK